MESLTPEQVEELKSALHSLQEELKKAFYGQSSESKPVEPDSAIGRISRMEAIQVQQIAQANRRTVRIRLEQIDAAFDRIEWGEYGECVECGEAIAYRRLKARPEAPFCIQCQNTRERP